MRYERRFSTLMYIKIYGDNEDLLGKWFQKTGKRDNVRVFLKLTYF